MKCNGWDGPCNNDNAVRYRMNTKYLNEELNLVFNSIDQAIEKLKLNKKVKWKIFNNELVRFGKYCPEPVIINGLPVLIIEETVENFSIFSNYN